MHFRIRLNLLSLIPRFFKYFVSPTKTWSAGSVDKEFLLRRPPRRSKSAILCHNKTMALRTVRILYFEGTALSWLHSCCCRCLILKRYSRPEIYLFCSHLHRNLRVKKDWKRASFFDIFYPRRRVKNQFFGDRNEIIIGDVEKHKKTMKSEAASGKRTKMFINISPGFNFYAQERSCINKESFCLRHLSLRNVAFSSAEIAKSCKKSGRMTWVKSLAFCNHWTFGHPTYLESRNA